MLVLNYIGFQIVFDKYLKEYEEVDLNYKTYLLADSHGARMGDYGEKNGIYNFSIVSDSYIDLKRKLSYLIKNGEVDTVFLTVDNHNLSSYRLSRNNHDRSSYFKKHEKVFKLVKYYLLERGLVFTNSKYRDIIKLYYTSDSEKKEPVLWKDLNDDKRQSQAEGRSRGQYLNKELAEELVKALEEIMLMCRENSIVLIGVKFPITSEMYEVSKEKSFGADKLMQKQGIEILDFTTEFQDRPELFRDVDHVNLTGAKEFWKVFNSALGRQKNY